MSARNTSLPFLSLPRLCVVISKFILPTSAYAMTNIGDIKKFIFISG